MPNGTAFRFSAFSSLAPRLQRELERLTLAKKQEYISPWYGKMFVVAGDLLFFEASAPRSVAITIVRLSGAEGDAVQFSYLMDGHSQGFDVIPMLDEAIALIALRLSPDQPPRNANLIDTIRRRS